MWFWWVWFFILFYLFLADLGWFGFGWSNMHGRVPHGCVVWGGADFFFRLLLFDPRWCASDYFVPEFVFFCAGFDFCMRCAE